MLKVLSVDFYALLDPDDIFYFVTPLVSIRFYILREVFYESFSVSTPVGDSINVKRVYKGFPISLPIRVTLVDLV